ncbi:hypothetical protein [Sutterella megalosphaeroides]|uniref:Uncharacterized protein n=1 Tax=Sutterella megalosphaeroides TaxID=2494234 RepID=A0A2Z6IDM0_9BURK|nr:hypothetical protein [Sutterella megalosphaeroides]BBF23228.1 hypothetical protein SUTMEG_11190 [Sutterella megalosphaeroides]
MLSTERNSRNTPKVETVANDEAHETTQTSATQEATEPAEPMPTLALDPASRAKRLSAAARTTVLSGLIAGGSAGFGVRVLESPGLLETAAVTAVLLVLGAGVVREEAGKLAAEGFARARRAILSAGAPAFLVVFALSFALSFLRPESLSMLPAMVGLKPSENTVLALDLLLPLALLGTVADRAAAGLFLRVFGPTEESDSSVDSDNSNA